MDSTAMFAVSRMSRPFQPFSRREAAERNSGVKPVVHHFKPEESGAATGHQGEPILVAALEILRRGEDLLSVLPRERYNQRVPSPLKSSIGEQYRLCLEPFTSLLGSLPLVEKGVLKLKPELKLESEPEAALQATRCARRQVELLTRTDLAQTVGSPWTVAARFSEAPQSGPTVGQALAHATAVAIEHFAVISAISQNLDVTVPPYFGSAPLGDERSVAGGQ